MYARDAGKLAELLKKATSAEEARKIIHDFSISEGFDAALEEYLKTVFVMGSNSIGFGAVMNFESMDEKVLGWIKARTFESKRLQDSFVQTKLTDYLKSYLGDGKTYGDFKDNINGLLKNMGVVPGEDEDGKPLKPHHVETIFRTEGATAANYGRYTAMKEAVDVAPLWKYVYVHDGRHSPGTICANVAANGGLIKPADWDGWSSIYPPNHFNCRSSVVPIPQTIIEKHGIEPTSSKGIGEPSEGFTGTQWEW